LKSGGGLFVREESGGKNGKKNCLGINIYDYI
jgi:hypothetical protein